MQWATGLFEGEGCITNYRTKPKYPNNLFQLRMRMTDLDVVEDFMEVVGCGKISFYPRRKSHWKDQHDWYLRDQDKVKDLLYEMLPYFGDRRAEKAIETLRALTT